MSILLLIQKNHSKSISILFLLILYYIINKYVKLDKLESIILIISLRIYLYLSVNEKKIE